jgi:hypothetical protein
VTRLTRWTSLIGRPEMSGPHDTSFRFNVWHYLSNYGNIFGVFRVSESLKVTPLRLLSFRVRISNLQTRSPRLSPPNFSSSSQTSNKTLLSKYLSHWDLREDLGIKVRNRQSCQKISFATKLILCPQIHLTVTYISCMWSSSFNGLC